MVSLTNSKHSYDTAVHLVPEVDGLRIIGNYTHEFFQRVPSVVEDIFRIGSMAPGAMLYEASKQFQVGIMSFLGVLLF